MSDAIRPAQFVGFLVIGGWLDRVGRRKRSRIQAPRWPGILLRRIAELDAAAVLLEDLADDREAEAGALLAGGDIGLEQPAAVFLRQADAVVDDVDDDVVAVARRRTRRCGRAPRVGRHGGDRLGGVLDDVGERLRDQAAVELRRHRILGELDLDVDVGIADPLQEHHLAHRVGDVLGRHHRLRHAGEARELVDHAPDVVDLAHDRVGALLEHRAVVGDDLAVFAAQPLGRELDRGQRVLDLVGDAAGDVGPGRGALRGDQLGDVVEGDDVAALGIDGLLAGDAHRDVAVAAAAADRDLALDQALAARSRLVDDLLELRRDLVERAPERVGLAAADELLGGAVEDADAALAVDADDAGAGAGEHRLGEAAAAVDHVAGAHDVVALGAQLLRHLVEGLAELGEIAFRAAHRHLDVQIAGRDDVGGADQPPDRRHQAVGEVEADPHRRQQHGERDHRVHQRERDLDAEAPRLEIGVLGDAGLGLANLRQHLRIDEAGDVEIGVVVAAQLDDRGDVVGVVEEADLRLGLRRLGQRSGGGTAGGLNSGGSWMSAVRMIVPSPSIIIAVGRSRSEACAVKNWRKRSRS